MQTGIIGKRYAKALLSLAEKAGSLEATGAELAQVALFYKENQVFRNFVLEPKYSTSKKIAVVQDLLQSSGASELVGKYCRFLVSKHRFDYIENISRAFNKLASEKLGIATAKITVAKPLTKDEETSLQKKLSDYTKKKVFLEVQIDPSIIGGAITTIGSMVLDGSIKTRLNMIRETISKGN